jgi:hypothetical protein
MTERAGETPTPDGVPAKTDKTGPSKPRRIWNRLTGTRGGRVELGALAASAVLFTATAFTVVPALAGAEKVEGEPVPEEDVPALVAAAVSCPSLTPPKIAGQVMAVSGFGTVHAGKDIAGLSDAAWKTWKPSTQAIRTDRTANIVALGHRLCDNVGKLRPAKIKGDQWPLAVAADHVGVEKVIAAKGIPDEAQDFVDEVTGYANWYADQDVFKAKPEQQESPATPLDAVAVPEEIVDSINAAGRICPTVTPVRIAAQLRSMSGFNPNLRSLNGAGGIAQFTPNQWEKYRLSKSASLWDPEDAIPALGSAMCDKSTQFTALGDPWVLALAAFQWGDDEVRRAGGVPRVNVWQLSEEAQLYVAEYQKDKRLKRETAKPTTKPTTKPSAKPSASTPATKPEETPKDEYEVEIDEKAKYQIQNDWAGSVIELPGDDVQDLPNGTPVQLWQNNKQGDAYWKLEKVGDGYVVIKNAAVDLVLSVKDASKERDAELIAAKRNPDILSQQWKLKDDGNGQIVLENRNSGRVAELSGDDIAPPVDGTWNGVHVDQWDLTDGDRDQRWIMLKG